MVVPRPILRWCAAFAAPGAGGRDGSAWQGLWPVLAHFAGLIGLGAAVLAGGLLPLGPLLLWGCYQTLLATHVSRGDTVSYGWVQLLQAVALLVVVPLLFMGLSFVQLSGDSGLPTVKSGEWLLLEASEEGRRLGDLVVMECALGEGIVLGRVVGLPGDRIFRQGVALCRNDRCYPTAAMVLETGGGGQVPAAMEVVGGRGHVVLPGVGDAGIEWGTALPVEVPEGNIAFLPDNRASVDFAHCTLGNIVIPASRVVGRPAAVIGAADWSRVGLSLR